MSLFDSLLFASVFRFSALLIGLAALVVAASQLKKARGGAVSLSWARTIAMLLLWTLVSGAVWIGVFILPLLIRYDLAMVTALALIVLHVVVGAWFVKRLPVRKLAIS